MHLNEPSRRLSSKAVFSALQFTSRLIHSFMLTVVMMAWLTVAAHAQTEFEIDSSTPNIEQNYREELDKWMLRAYEGDRDAQFKVGVLFTNKQFDQPDYEQAVYWYKQAARQGHVLAQYNLGHQYLMGVGVKENQKTAMEWWLQAAEQDHALAQFNVGRAYYLGIGLPEDHQKSRYWFNRAADNQEPKSIEILQQLGWVQEQQAEDGNGADTVAQSAASNTNTAAVSSSGIQEPSLISKIVPTALLEDAEPATSNASKESAETERLAAAQGQQPELKSASTGETPAALYTNPKVRSVLISILDDRSSLKVIERGNEWLTVTSDTGFPVWVHQDYISVKGRKGSITGSAVNARSVPIITNGTVVGRLEKNEIVTVLDNRKEWYRIVAPVRFKAWVKADDYDRLPVEKTTVASAETKPESEPEAKPEATPPSNKPQQQSASDKPKLTDPRPVNDNQWLYSQPSENFTLQLASFDDPAKVKEFVSRAKFADNPELHQFSSKGKDLQWTYFLYGSYPDRAQAELIKTNIKQKRAWLRTFGMLQQNRCVSWKKQLPSPPELNKYCGS